MTSQPPVLGIDCRFAALHTGIGRYVRGLVPPLLQYLPTDITVILFVQSDNEPWLQQIKTSVTTVPTSISHYSLREQFELPTLQRRHGITHWFAPHFNVPLFSRLPLIVTIHDLILHRYPNNASLIKRLVYKTVLRHAVRVAASIISVSQFTATDIKAEYPAVSDKITVIPEAVEDHFQPQSDDIVTAVRQKYGISKKYYLYVGNAKQHKNVSVLLEAFKIIQSEDVQLVLISGGPEAAQLQLPKNTVLLSGIDEAELCALYTGALAFVTPSLYEGFCLPLLEARACGCRIVASNKTAIPESAGEAAVLTEPTADALAKGMEQILDSPPPVRPKRTWSHVAQETAALVAAQIS